MNFHLVQITDWVYFGAFNPQTPDRFTPSHARCGENCGSELTHRSFGKNSSSFLYKMMWLKTGYCEYTVNTL